MKMAVARQFFENNSCTKFHKNLKSNLVPDTKSLQKTSRTQSRKAINDTHSDAGPDSWIRT
jgi:hypothetical protein